MKHTITLWRPLLALVTIAMTCRTSYTAPIQMPNPDRGFVSTTPAETWEEGLLSGNGKIGANVFGQPNNETIVFTHSRMFLPMGPPVAPPDTSSRLFEVRDLIERGLYKQATKLAFDFSGQEGFMYPDPFVPCFDLLVAMPSKGERRDYARAVNFRTAEASVLWSDENGSFERKLFVSRADDVAFLRISGSKKGSLECTLQLTPRSADPKLGTKVLEASKRVYDEHVSKVTTTADASFLTFTSTFTKAYPGSIHRLEAVSRIVVTGGKVRPEGSAVLIEGADEVLVLTKIQPIYDPEKPQIEAMKSALSRLSADYEKLQKRHAAIHGEMFERMRLDLGGKAERDKTSEELLSSSTNESLSRALTEKVFDAGRYNIICSTGDLPPNLQGIWAGTYVPPWASDFTHNGNVPSAIAALLPGNNPDLMLAYISYIESMVPYLRVNAKHIFGARGVVLPSRSSATAYNNALAPDFAGGMWVAGAPWAAHFFYDYYLFTGDRKFLAERALPFMEEVALFFEDYLYLGPDGKYIFNPSTSRELPEKHRFPRVAQRDDGRGLG